jgi:DNA-entry nuclease
MSEIVSNDASDVSSDNSNASSVESETDVSDESISDIQSEDVPSNDVSNSTSDISSELPSAEDPSYSSSESSPEKPSEAPSEAPSEEPSKDPTPNNGVGVESEAKADLNKIPSFFGEGYYILNGNIPFFTKEQLTSKGYEKYGELDSLGRCTVALASVGKDTMPTDPRGSISSVKPTGWIQKKYSCIPTSDLYNRSHLIAWSLSGENANKQNLVTGTAFMNQTTMTEFENMVLDYIKETNNHVAYRVTPIFKGNELVCRGVQMEAYSVEDNGEGICFNVFCYNVQPGVIITYLTGESKSENGEEDNSGSDTSTDITEKADYILNKSSKKIHLPNCDSVNKMSEKNKQAYTGSIEDLLKDGYTCCGSCLA